MLSSLRAPFAAFALTLALSFPALAQLEPVEPVPGQEPAPALEPAAPPPVVLSETDETEDTGVWEPDRPEPGSVEKIREYTTAPEFLPETVSYVPDSDT